MTKRERSPAATLRSFHAFYLDGLEKFAQAADDFAYGVDHLDAERIQKASDEIRQASQSFNQALAQLPQ